MASNQILFNIEPQELIELIRISVKKEIQPLTLNNDFCSRPTYFTREETASILKICVDTLDDYNDRGLIQSKSIGKRILYSNIDIELALVSTKKK